MADVITRFKLETTQYDSKLRDAAQGLSKLSQQLQIAGKDFDRFAQKDVEVAKAFGQVESGATNIKDKLKDLVSAYNNVAKAYNQLTNEQKSTDFGKAMASSLDHLKGRITQTKTELYSMSEGSNKLGDSISDLASKFGLNIKQLSAWGAALAAVKGSLDVMKDAFFTSESNVNEWGRVIESSEGVYNSFLQTLNNGDFSGFFNRIQDVIDKSREAYNALDELQTRGGIVSSERLRLQARQTELKSIIRRNGADSAEGKAAQAELRQLESKIQNAYSTEQKLNYNAFKAEVDKRLKEAGINLNQKSYNFLMRSFSDDSAFQTLKRNANGARAFGKDEYEIDSSNPLNLKKIDPRNTEQKLLDLFTDEWRKEYKPLLDASFSARNAAASSLLGDARYLKQGTGGGGSGKGGKGGTTAATIDELLSEGAKEVKSKAFDFSDAAMGATQSMKQLQDILRMYNDALLNATNRQEYNAALSGIEETQAKINAQPTALKAGLTIEQVQFHENFTTQVREQLEEEFRSHPLEIELSGGKKMKKLALENEEAWTGVADALQSAAGAMAAFNEPSLNIAATIAKSIASVAFAFSQSLKGTATPWDFIAGVAGGVAAMASAVAAIKSVGKDTGEYADGGVIPGNNFSGDNLIAHVNSGEMILNRAAQGNLASLLNDGRTNAGTVNATVSADTIRLTLRNGARKVGKSMFDYLEL